MKELERGNTQQTVTGQGDQRSDNRKGRPDLNTESNHYEIRTQ